MSSIPPSPYKGLRSFDDSDLDALLFFGRERDREVIVANLLAARLTVLYGPSGVGKSSVLSAGVARQLRELPESPLVVVFSSWAEGPARTLAGAVAAAAGVEEDGSLVDVLEAAARLAQRGVHHPRPSGGTVPLSTRMDSSKSSPSLSTSLIFASTSS